jgi:hypothetical protein
MNHYYYQNAMQPYAPQQADPVQQQQQDMSLLLNAAKTGAIVGGTGAAAMNLHRMRQDGLAWQQAATNTLKVSLTAGVATAAATAVGRMFVRHPTLSLVATIATGTAVMYALSDKTSADAEVDDE